MAPPRPYDTVELATTGRSTCKLCMSKIANGSPRAKMHSPHHSGRYWNTKFYHVKCMKTTSIGKELWNQAKLSPEMLQRGKTGSNLSRLDLLDLGAVQASDKSKKKNSVDQATLQERSKLREKLRTLRKHLSVSFGFGTDYYLVFNNKTLDNLVLDMPCNSTELLKVNGFAQKRADSLGRFILPIIREYQRNMSANFAVAKSAAATIPSLEEEEEEDDEVIFESHETIEEKVTRIFKEAQEKGEVISL